MTIGTSIWWSLQLQAAGFGAGVSGGQPARRRLVGEDRIPDRWRRSRRWLRPPTALDGATPGAVLEVRQRRVLGMGGQPVVDELSRRPGSGGACSG